MKNNWQIKRKNNLSKAERDELSIQRDALLQKKRFIDAIDKLQKNAPRKQKIFETDCNFLINAANINNKNRLEEFLSSMNNKAVSIEIYKRGGEFFWRNDPVKITISKTFDIYAKVMREEYHKLNDYLKEEVKKANYWQLTNPLWLFYWLVRNIWKHKLILILITLITLLGIDYTIAWKNTIWLMDSIKNFFR